MALTQVTPDVLHNIQSNVTQVGTLSNLTVSGNATVGNVIATNFTYANGVSILTPVMTAWQANAAIQAGDIATLYANAGAQSGSIATLTANAGAQSSSIATLTANAAVQAGDIATLFANAAVQAGAISTLQNAGYITAAYVQTAGRNSQGNKTVQSISAGVPSNATGSDGDIIYQY